MNIGKYFILATTPIAALSIFNIYRRTFSIELNSWMSEVSRLSEEVVHVIVNAGPERILGFEPPQILSDMWVFSFWWTGVMASATVGAMKDKGAPTPWNSRILMLLIQILLGYSFIGFFWAMTVVPMTFARFKTGDEDVDRYGHWIRVFTMTNVFLVAALFLLNYLT